jgi:transcription elongation factor Elf1
MTESKSCPGCGSEAAVFQQGAKWVVMCTCCPWTILPQDTRAGALIIWNTRVAPTVELSDCPFCGGEPKRKSAGVDSGKLYYISCSLCAARSSPAETPKLAISRWEQRSD